MRVLLIKLAHFILYFQKNFNIKPKFNEYYKNDKY